VVSQLVKMYYISMCAVIEREVLLKWKMLPNRSMTQYLFVLFGIRLVNVS